MGYDSGERAPAPRAPAGIPGILNPFQQLSDPSPVYRGSLDSTISPRLQNRFYFGVNLFHDSNYPLSEGGNWQNKICVPNLPDCNRNLPILRTAALPLVAGNPFHCSANPGYSFH